MDNDPPGKKGAPGSGGCWPCVASWDPAQQSLPRRSNRLEYRRNYLVEIAARNDLRERTELLATGPRAESPQQLGPAGVGRLQRQRDHQTLAVRGKGWHEPP